MLRYSILLYSEALVRGQGTDLRAPIKVHERIKMRLRLAGTSLAQIGRQLGVRPSTVASVSRGTSRSRRIEDSIARALGTEPQKLWPDRYSRCTESEARPTAAPGRRAPMT